MRVTCSDLSGMDCINYVRKTLTLVALGFVNRLYVQDKCRGLIVTSGNCCLFLRPILSLSFCLLIVRFFSFYLAQRCLRHTIYLRLALNHPYLLGYRHEILFLA